MTIRTCGFELVIVADQQITKGQMDKLYSEFRGDPNRLEVIRLEHIEDNGTMIKVLVPSALEGIQTRANSILQRISTCL